MSRADADAAAAGPAAGAESPAAQSPNQAAQSPNPAVQGSNQAAQGSNQAVQGSNAAAQGSHPVGNGSEPAGESQRAAWAGWDPVVRVGGVIVAVLAALFSGVLEIFLSTLRAGDVVTVWRGDAIGSGSGPLLGLSVVLAAVVNYALGWFAVTTTGRRWAIGPPWALWTLLMLFAASVRTDEGDYLLGGANWVALVMILVGSLSFAMYSYRMILKGPRP